MIIDAYVLYGRWPYWNIRVKAAQELIALLDKYAIDRALVISTRSVFLDCAQGNREVAALAAQYPDRILGIATINPKAGPLAVREFHWALEQGMKGLALFPLYHAYSLADPLPALEAIVGEAALRAVPIMLSTRLIMNWALPVLEAREAAPLFTRFPQARFVLTGVNREEGALAMMRRFPNVALETSCVMSPFMIERLIAQFGLGRVLYGSGLPLQYPACGLAKVRGAEISEAQREAVLAGNAARLFGIDS